MRVFIRPIAGGRTITLSEGQDAFEYQPRWSPDGNQILFLTPAGVFVASAMGGTTRQVAAGAIGAAAWAPDGKRILIVRETAMTVATLDGGGETPLATAPHPLYSCDWSRVGDRIACAHGNRLGVLPGATFGNLAPSGIVVRSADGSFVDVTGLKSGNQSPVWSADGRRLYFVQPARAARRVRCRDRRERRARRRAVPGEHGSGAQAISLAASEGRLAYVHDIAKANIWSVGIPGSGKIDLSGAQAVTSGNQVIEAISVSRDGRWLFYDSALHGNAELFRLSVAGGTAERLTVNAADDFGPQLSPDEREIAYHSWLTGSRDIFVMPAGGGPAQQITNTPSQESYPTWSPDGRGSRSSIRLEIPMARSGASSSFAASQRESGRHPCSPRRGIPQG